MKRHYSFKLFIIMAIFFIAGCSDNFSVGVGPKGKLYFYDSKSWKDQGILIYENFDPEYFVNYLYWVKKDSVLLCPDISSNTNDCKTYPLEWDLDKFILYLKDTEKHAVYEPK